MRCSPSVRGLHRIVFERKYRGIIFSEPRVAYKTRDSMRLYQKKHQQKHALKLKKMKILNAILKSNWVTVLH